MMPNAGEVSSLGKFLLTRLLPSAVALAILLMFFSPFAVIQAGHRGVVTTFGKVSPEVLGEGIHLVIPVVNQVHKIDVRLQKSEGSGEAASKDLQTIHTAIALNFHLKPSAAATTFQEIGGIEAVRDRIIAPAIPEAVKAITARYTAEELISKREEVRDHIKEPLVERLGRHGIVVDEFAITNFDFSKSFNDAIEAKTTAEQLKLKADRDLARIMVEAQQKIEQAKAEA